jgi:hypothetical protein
VGGVLVASLMTLLNVADTTSSTVASSIDTQLISASSPPTPSSAVRSEHGREADLGAPPCPTPTVAGVANSRIAVAETWTTVPCRPTAGRHYGLSPDLPVRRVRTGSDHRGHPAPRRHRHRRVRPVLSGRPARSRHFLTSPRRRASPVRRDTERQPARRTQGADHAQLVTGAARDRRRDLSGARRDRAGKSTCWAMRSHPACGAHRSPATRPCSP